MKALRSIAPRVLRAGALIIGLLTVTSLTAAEHQQLGRPMTDFGTAPLVTGSPLRPLDATQLYNHGDPTVHEQYMLELVNRARANPPAEAARLAIDLNENLPPNTISPDPKPPLALHPLLIESSRAHSLWMLANDIFDHTGITNSSPGDRMINAGYVFSGSWTWGEIISWRGTTGTPDVTDFTGRMHDGLFISPGHRKNLMNATFDEVGIGLEEGVFLYDGTPYNSVMGTQNFAKSASTPEPLLLGVVYEDANGNEFYDPGEGVPNVRVTPAGGDWYAVTSTSGGYAVPFNPSGATPLSVTFSDGPLTTPYVTTTSRAATNVKLDVDLLTASVVPIILAADTASWSMGQGFQIEVTGPAGTGVHLEWSTDFSYWTPLETHTLGSGATPLSDPNAPAGAARFYRVASED